MIVVLVVHETVEHASKLSETVIVGESSAWANSSPYSVRVAVDDVGVLNFPTYDRTGES